MFQRTRSKTQTYVRYKVINGKVQTTRAIKVHKLKKEILFDFRFLKDLATQNVNSVFNKDSYVKQAVNCLFELFENSYAQECIFAKDFNANFNISFVILKCFVINFVFVFVFFFLVLNITLCVYLLLLLWVVNAVFIVGVVQLRANQQILYSKRKRKRVRDDVCMEAVTRTCL